jgi:hypothetical protein
MRIDFISQKPKYSIALPYKMAAIRNVTSIGNYILICKVILSTLNVADIFFSPASRTINKNIAKGKVVKGSKKQAMYIPGGTCFFTFVIYRFNNNNNNNNNLYFTRVTC